MQRKQHIDMLGACILVGFSVLLGLNQALVKLVNEGFAPIFQGGFRSVCAFLPVLLFALVMKRKLTMRDGSFAYGILNGVFFCLEFAFLFLALDYTTVARASLFFYTMPVWVAIGAHFLVPGEHLNRYKVVGLILALVGVAYAFLENSSTTSGSILGDFFALIAGVCWAGIALTTRTKLSACSAEMNLLYQLAVSAIVLTLISPLFGEPIREPTTTIALIFSFQVIVVVSVGFVVWFWLLSIYPVSNVASFGLLSPVFGVFFGWLIFDDPLTLAFLASILLVGLGLVLINKPPPDQSQSDQSQTDQSQTDQSRAGLSQ